MNMSKNITLSLLSHTGKGKTTQSQTLLKDDVGRVTHEAHSTIVSDSWVWLCEKEHQLILMDNPGFGAKIELLRDDATGEPGLLRSGWQKAKELLGTDEPTRLAREAIEQTRNKADIVLYFVNAGAEPKNCRYLKTEMEILKDIDKPVVVILNEMGDPRDQEHANERKCLWTKYLERFKHVKDVLPLDAFSHYWTQEGRLLESVSKLVDVKKKPSADCLLKAWYQREKTTLRYSLLEIDKFLRAAAREKHEIPKRTFLEYCFTHPNNKKWAAGTAKKLKIKVEIKCTEMLDSLVRHARISGNDNPIKYPDPTEIAWDRGFFFNIFFGSWHCQLSKEALKEYAFFALSFYLGISHHGRGQGIWKTHKRNLVDKLDENWPWAQLVRKSFDDSEYELNRLWDRLRKSDKTTSKDLSALYQPLLDLLAEQYPDSKHFLPPPGDIPTSPEEDAKCEPDEESE